VNLPKLPPHRRHTLVNLYWLFIVKSHAHNLLILISLSILKNFDLYCAFYEQKDTQRVICTMSYVSVAVPHPPSIKIHFAGFARGAEKIRPKVVWCRS